MIFFSSASINEIHACLSNSRYRSILVWLSSGTWSRQGKARQGKAGSHNFYGSPREPASHADQNDDNRVWVRHYPSIREESVPPAIRHTLYLKNSPYSESVEL